MALIADILFVAGALGAGFYCFVLSRRLSQFADLETGMGGAIAVLSAQIADMTRSLKAAQAAAGSSSEDLAALTERAEKAARRLELHIAALHDIDGPEKAPHAVDHAAAADEFRPFQASEELARAADRSAGAGAAAGGGGAGDWWHRLDGGAPPAGPDGPAEGRPRRSVFSSHRGLGAEVAG
ncbi:MAG: hypothetical protein ACU0AT_04095 [Tranquillimonas sp.]